MNKEMYFASKPRYEILDGLRGVAAMMVVAFHLFEMYIGQIGTQIINHGHLAVDFFFVLSGFVIGYAYDERWRQNKLSTWGFFKRRLVRLHPMLIAGTVMGCLLFYMGDCAMFCKVGETPWYTLLGMAALGILMIPVPASMDIRGWAETYPINGPQWSLMLEYIANIVYCFVLRRLPTYAIVALTLLAAVFTIDLGLGLDILGDLPTQTTADGQTVPLYQGNFIGGWGIEGWQWHIALVRLSFPFLAGYLLSKGTRHIQVSGGFWWCSLMLVIFFSIPQLGEGETAIYNGIYETLVILVLFPIIVSMGAGSTIEGRRSQAVCKWLGDISYPIYITHFGLMYMQMAWVERHPDAPLATHIFVSASTFLLSVGTAHALHKLYDLPVRAWLTE
ncbi:MAG: acyltransferase, partial [Bacteroidaceae bacterium]|nr:acyltransferase [Bacteroidaceae bacterium]